MPTRFNVAARLLLLLSGGIALRVDTTMLSRRLVLSAAAGLAMPGAAFASAMDNVKALDASACAAGGGGSAPPVLSAKSKSINLVAKVTVTAGESVEYLWIKDAASGAILAASAKSPLVTSLDKGKKVVPVVKYQDGACVAGSPVELVPGLSLIE